MSEALYTVKQGDTLWGISHKLGVDVNYLAKINHLHGMAIHRLHIGQAIKLPGSRALFDTELSIQILDIKFEPIKNAYLKLQYDGKTHEVSTDINGVLTGIIVNDHAKGLKVEFRGIDGKYTLIADHAKLPLGRKKLTLTSRTIKLKGNYHGKPGAMRQAKKDIRCEVRAANKNVHINPQGATPKQTEVKVNDPSVVDKETRIEEGIPVQIAATVFTEANLLLPPSNEKFRKLIITSAQNFSFTPQVLAALIDTEATKKYSNGAWLENSFNRSTNAAGLTQFLVPTWLEVAVDSRSLINQRLKTEKGYKKILGRGQGQAYHLIGINGDEEIVIDSEEVLAWRFVAEYSIDAAALYGRINLERLSKRGINVDALAPEDLAKVVYLAHHDGLIGAVAVLRGTLEPEKAALRLKEQIGAPSAAALIARFEKKSDVAYRYWLYNVLIDKKINVAHFTVQPDGVEPKPMSEIAQLLGGVPAQEPTVKEEPKVVVHPAEAGAAQGWHDPLEGCTIRTARLASKRGAMFGMVRDGGKRPHQGIDLEANPGTPIYAAANGKVLSVNNNDTPGENYGKTLIFAVDVADLPPQQQQAVKNSPYPKTTIVYFFYAHLSQIDVKKSGKFLPVGTPLGLTGDTGNARGMTSIQRGAHLHFEVRVKATPDLHLADRIDPLPFIQQCSNRT